MEELCFGYANDIKVPEIVVIVMLIGLFITPFVTNEKEDINLKQKIWFILIFLGLTLLILTGLYLTWSPVGYEVIAGVQGRYFIPAIILILLCLINKNKKVEYKNIELKYFVTFLVLNIIPIMHIIERI